MSTDDQIRTLLIGGSEQGANQAKLNLKMANRHGLIAGATGTGKTVTLQILAEAFSKEGVPVVMADVKGDLSGLGITGKPHKKIDERIESIGVEGYHQQGFPCVFWDLFGKRGHMARTTISEFGPLLLANFLNLNETQTGVLYIAFSIADDQGMLLLDLKDLKAVLNFMKQERASLEAEYGGISGSSIAAIQRRFLVLEQQKVDDFFGEPAIELEDFIRTDLSGKGIINILDSTTLIQQPRVYAIFLLWLISELFEQLPEIGDADKPKLVFFFDEAHLLFKNAPPILTEKIEQVVRLIRSKGVGIYFITQSPADIPDSILGQLGNRIQHALRAFTPKEQKAVRVAAQSFRPNPAFSTTEAITALGLGEALVSVLDKKGSPTMVERVLVRPPESRMGPMKPAERAEVFNRSPFKGRYDKGIDRESAYETLKARSEKKLQDEEAQEKSSKGTKNTKARKSNHQGIFETLAKSVARSIGSSLGRQIMRGVLGSILGGKR